MLLRQRRRTKAGAECTTQRESIGKFIAPIHLSDQCIAGRIVVAFQDPQPTTVVLTGARDTLVADATDAITITAQLYDSAGNLSLLPDIPVSFGLDNGSTGNGQFEVPTTLTNGTGLATGRVLATGAGSLLVTASVVIENRVLDVLAYDLDSDLTDRMSLNLGLRYERWKADYADAFTDYIYADPTQPVEHDFHPRENLWGGDISLDYQLNGQARFVFSCGGNCTKEHTAVELQLGID